MDTTTLGILDREAHVSRDLRVMSTLGATLKIGGQCPALKMKSAMSGPGIRKVCLSGLRWTSSDVLSTTKAPAWGKVCSLW